MEKKNETHLYTVLSVAKACGVSPHTIRAWEKRYNCVEPMRLANGRRMYNREQTEYLQTLAQLTREGHSIKKLTEIPKTEIKSFLENSRNLNFRTSSTPHVKVQNYQSEILDSLKGYKLDKISELLGRSRLEMGIKEFVLEIALPLLADVGRLVMSRKINIAQEHALSAILRDQLAQISFSNSIGDRVVALTTPEGNHHEFGIYLASILCKLYGIKGRYFGTNMPADSLIQALNSLNIDTLILGATPGPKDKEVISLDKYLQELERYSTKRLNVWIGGERPSPHKFEFLHIVYFNNFYELDRKLAE